MNTLRFVLAIISAVSELAAQPSSARPKFDSFEVATIKPAIPEPGRYIKMQSAHRLFAKNHTLKSLITAAYNLPPVAISGGPAWLDSEHFDIVAGTPGEVRPTLDEQMSMLRSLLAERFKLTFEWQKKTLSIYTLSVAKSGSKLKASAATDDVLPELINVVYPNYIALPARNANMVQFASMLQRAVVDRPVVDETGLAGKFDFNLEWAFDESQFGGELRKPAGVEESPKPGLYAALQEQLGLKLQPARGPISAMVILNAERPSVN